MTYVQPRWFQQLCLCTCVAITASVTLLGCGSNGGGAGGTDQFIVDAGTGSSRGCVQASFPPEEPDLVSEPTFKDEQLQPGDDIEAEIRIDAETRNVKVELVNAWSPTVPPIKTLEPGRGGPATIPLLFSFPDEPPTSGRYVMKVTLCGANCDEARVLFTLVFEDPNFLPKYYQRIVYEGDEEVGSEDTCLRVNTVVLQ